MNVGNYPLVGGMIQQLNNIDHISNNLANLNTTSYKNKHATQETFTDVLGKMSGRKIDLNLENNTVDAADYINRSLNLIPRQGNLYTNEEVGSLIQTGNAFDFAISTNQEYFVVENNNGDKRITRDGGFLVEDGILMTKQNEYVLNNQGKKIDTTVDGWEQTIGLTIKDTNTLKTIGNNTYIANGSLGDLFSRQESVVQGALESSNVNGILEMASLIDSHRLFDQMQKTMHSFQEISKISSEKIGNYKG